jgi:hypothetical protein
VPSPPSLSDLSRPELEALLIELFGKVAALEKIVGEQREEIARLKGVEGPSGHQTERHGQGDGAGEGCRQAEAAVLR